MFVAALCPTYHRDALLRNSLAMWLAQDYPADQRRLYILDDGGTFDDQQGDTWELRTLPYRAPTLAAKYNMLQSFAPTADAYLIWEDDDIYLPGYVSAHAECLKTSEWSRPACNFSHYGGQLQIEQRSFHSAEGVTRALWERVEGYPNTMVACFDGLWQLQLEHKAESIGYTWDDPHRAQYVMGFADTGSWHSSCSIKNPNDIEWYVENAWRMTKPPHAGKLTAEYDRRTLWVYDELERQGWQCSPKNIAR